MFFVGVAIKEHATTRSLDDSRVFSGVGSSALILWVISPDVVVASVIVLVSPIIMTLVVLFVRLVVSGDVFLSIPIIKIILYNNVVIFTVFCSCLGWWFVF